MVLLWECGNHSSTIIRKNLNFWKTLFGDECTFHLSVRVNQHNCRIWGKSNSAEILEHERDFPKLVVWCTISSIGKIGPFLFFDASGKMTTVTDENYMKMLKEFAVPHFQTRSDLANVFFFLNKMEPFPAFLG